MKESVYDVVIIGGGPSGMMAAISASMSQKKVLLLEKNDHLGKKLLITGGGRCNVTNSEPDIRTFLSYYKESDKFLFSAFSQHNQKDTLEFFNKRNMATKVEQEGRVFPQSDSARTVYNVLVKELEKQGVEIITSVSIEDIHVEKKHIKEVVFRLKQKKYICKARSYILATGGTSHPETGSTGDAYPWLEKMGHTVIAPKPVLVPLTIQESWVKKLQGVTISPVAIFAYEDGKKIFHKKGKILFTHFGVTGPTILNISKRIRDGFDQGKHMSLCVDIFPNKDLAELHTEFQSFSQLYAKRKIKNILTEICNPILVDEILKKLEIPEETTGAHITREMRVALVDYLKKIPMTVTGALGEDKAIISSGGIALTEIDSKTCRSKICDNLFIIGDLLYIDRPSGGFSLQLCWTTGWVSGKHA